MASIRWSPQPPARGGVFAQYVSTTPDGVRLTIEIRAGGSWLWIEDDGGTRVLAFPDTDVNGVLGKLSGVEELPSTSTYMIHMSKLGVSLVAHEQFERAYVNMLPPPGDAVYFYYSDVLGDLHRGSARDSFHAQLGDPAPPSATAALRLGLQALGFENGPRGPSPRIGYADDNPQWPDPRRPRARLDFTLFHRTPAGWQPAVPPPDPGTVQAIAEIANTGYAVPEWAERAAQLGPRFGGRPDALVSVLAHGAPLPRGREPFDWLMRVQTVAALVLAYLDGGWFGSRRRRALFHLALGPVDWPVQAAIIALHHVAQTIPETRDDIEQLFVLLQGNAARNGYTCYAPALATLWLQLGPRRIAVEELRRWGREAWSGGPRGPLAHDGSEQEAARAVIREALQGLDPVSDEGMRMIAAFR